MHVHFMYSYKVYSWISFIYKLLDLYAMCGNRCSHLVPYSLKFSKLKLFAVFAGYDSTTKILSREFFTLAYNTFMGVAINFARARALAGHRSRTYTACMLVPTGCRYRR